MDSSEAKRVTFKLKNGDIIDIIQADGIPIKIKQNGYDVEKINFEGKQIDNVEFEFEKK